MIRKRPLKRPFFYARSITRLIAARTSALATKTSWRTMPEANSVASIAHARAFEGIARERAGTVATGEATREIERAVVRRGNDGHLLAPGPKLGERRLEDIHIDIPAQQEPARRACRALCRRCDRGRPERLERHERTHRMRDDVEPRAEFILKQARGAPSDSGSRASNANSRS